MLHKWRPLLVMILICMIFSSCTAQPIQQLEETGISQETVSGRIQLELPVDENLEYPAEYPSAQTQPPLDRTGNAQIDQADKEEKDVWASAASKEVRAVWFSYLEFKDLLTGRNAEQFTANIRQAFERVQKAGFNTVFVQVRPYADALYASKHFQWSHIVTGTEGEDPGFDPFGIMIEQARAHRLRVEAWINPYRVRTDSKNPLSAQGAVSQWIAQGTDDVIKFNGGIYLNPASENAQSLIVNGVKEIVQNYDVDGIHFDDYFYPTTSAEFDKTTYTNYRENGGTQSLGNWRRENVNKLILSVYQSIKEINPKVLFGISPQGNNDNNYNTQYADVAKWLANEGYVDYICPQIYFGFQNSTAPFAQTVEQWNRLIKIDSIQLYVGMAPYKLGNIDKWAGDGENEWLNTSDLLARMVQTSRQQSHYGGFSMYRYQSLFHPDDESQEQVQEELQNLHSILQ